MTEAWPKRPVRPMTRFAALTQHIKRILIFRVRNFRHIYRYVYIYIMHEELKPVLWVGSSQKDVRSFPSEVRREIGHALYAAQKGETDPAAKPLR
jgi:phage-related protein